MSDPDQPPDETAEPREQVEEPAPAEGLELEVIDAVPVVPAQERSRLPGGPLALPAVQAAAAAATGFLAGAATLALLRRSSGRRLARDLAELRELRNRLESARGRPEPFPLAPGRSYLVHVRVLSRPPFQ